MSSFQIPSLMRRLLLSALLALPAATQADIAPYVNDHAYDRGELGNYPIQEYKTTDLKSPRVNILQARPECKDGSYIFINPRGNAVRENGGPMIIDQEGTLIWMSTDYEQTYNMQVQTYRGEEYITFWSGNDAVGGHGAGHYYMLDKTYKQVRKIEAAGGLRGDLHEFRFTENGTALITSYDVQPADLSAVKDKEGSDGDPKDGYIWDSLFQEIDIETGELLFQWRASEHYEFEESYQGVGGRGGTQTYPHDYFHINSVYKDPWGNYLVSSRYMHTLTYINGTDGEVIWVLGGKRNMFKDLSDGAATNFSWQHDARWHDNYTSVTLFDNGAKTGEYTADYSRGLHIDLDQEAMTAKMRYQYINPNRVTSSSQGSVQILPNGHVQVGYGFNGLFTEFAQDGTPLCDIHFQPSARWESGDVQSYRALKFNWTATPYYPPAFNITDDTAYVSWNGATEVRRWVLQDSDYPVVDDEAWRPIETVEKLGFESSLKVIKDTKPYVRAAAVDENDRIIGVSETIDMGYLRENVESHSLHLDGADTWPIVGLICVVGLISIVMGTYRAISCLRPKKWQGLSSMPGIKSLRHRREQDAEQRAPLTAQPESAFRDDP